MAATHETSRCSLLPRAFGLVLRQAQASQQISDETFAQRAGITVDELHQVLHGEHDLLLGNYIRLAAAVRTPLETLLLEAERLADALLKPESGAQQPPVKTGKHE